LNVEDIPRTQHHDIGPAFYARPAFLNRPRLRDWWTVLHPPYTMLHLSLVTIGACLVGPVNAVRLVVTLVAFFLAVGIGAHCLDELHGRPLATSMPAWQLVLAASIGVGGAVILGIVGMFLVSPYLAIFICVGVVIAVGYNLELFHGRLHTDLVLIIGWGSFPVLTAYFAQHARLGVASLFVAAFGALLTRMQRQLSTPARQLRRKAVSAEGVVVLLDGTTEAITKQSILRPLEGALKTLCWSGPTLAVALVLLRFIHQ
jgi:hypothetical protein